MKVTARASLMKLLIVASVGISPAWAAPDYSSLAKEFMTQLVDVAQKSKTQKGAVSQDSQTLVKSVSGRIDFSALARRSLGTRWTKYPAVDRTRFMATLQELLEVVVYPKAKNISVKGEDIKYEAVKGKSGEIKAMAEIEREKKGELVTEKLDVVLIFDSKSGKIVDAIIEEEQISANLKRQFDEALKKKTFQQIIEQMKKRVDEAKAKKT